MNNNPSKTRHINYTNWNGIYNLMLYFIRLIPPPSLRHYLCYVYFYIIYKLNFNTTYKYNICKTDHKIINKKRENYSLDLHPTHHFDVLRTHFAVLLGPLHEVNQSYLKAGLSVGDVFILDGRVLVDLFLFLVNCCLSFLLLRRGDDMFVASHSHRLLAALSSQARRVKQTAHRAAASARLQGSQGRDLASRGGG